MRLHIASAALLVCVTAVSAQQPAQTDPKPAQSGSSFTPPRDTQHPAPPKLTPAEAARRYAEGLDLDQRGDQRGAFAAYREAAEAGDGLAQKKLGDLYGSGNAAVARDYETSLLWYDRARKQGVEIPRPFTYPGVRQAAPRAAAAQALPSPSGVPEVASKNPGMAEKSQLPQDKAGISVPKIGAPPQSVLAVKPVTKSDLKQPQKADAKPTPKPEPKKLEPKPKPEVKPKPKPATSQPAPEKRIEQTKKTSQKQEVEKVPSKETLGTLSSPPVSATSEVTTPSALAVPPSVKPSSTEAARRYSEGLALDQRGDLKGAFTAYLGAAEAGDGLAQKKLGDIYGTGNAVIPRDYEASVRWYERARQQGVEVPKPFTYPGIRR